MRYSIFIFIFVYCFFSSVYAGELVQLHPYKRHISLTGFTRPKTAMTVSAEVSGKCTAVLVDVGDSVGPDGVVAKIDSTFIKLDLAKNTIAQDQASHQLELERKTLARYTSLVSKKSTAQATYDEAVLQAEIHVLALKSLKNEASRLQELMNRHTLYGPAGWKVMQRFIEPGEFIQQGEPIVHLGNFQALIIPFLMTYEELELLQKTDGPKLYFPDFDRSMQSRIFRIAPDFDEKRKKITVELIVEQESSSTVPTLRGGLRVQLKLDGNNENSAFLVPFSSLVSRYEAHWLVTENGQQKQVILMGKSENGEDAIITGKNLASGDSFLASPQLNP